MIIYYLLIIYLTLFAVLAWRKMDWAIYLIVFSLPSYLIRFSILNLPMTLLEAMILILFLIWVIKGDKKKYTDYKLYIYIFLFILSATISLFISPDLRVAAGIWKAYFIEPILFLVVFINTINIKKNKNILIIFSIGAVVLSGVAIYQKITGDLIPNPFWADEITRRVTGVFPYPNALALYLAPIAVWMIGSLGIFTRTRHGVFLQALIVVLGLTTIYFTKSKGAILGILAGLIFYALFYKNYRKYFAGALGIIVIFVFLYFHIFNIPLNLEGSPTVEGGGSLSTRIDMWGETWEMLKTKSISGAGLSGYQSSVAPYHQKNYIEIYLYPHNIFLNFWTEIGILGLVSFILIIIWFYRKGFKSSQTILMGAMTCLLVHGLVDVPYFKNDLSVLFWILIGSMIIFQDQEKLI